MLIITPKAEIDAYYASDDMSQSQAKKLLKGIENFKREDKDISTQSYIVLGKAVDTILTGEEGEFEENFHISEAEKKPTDAVAAIIEMVHNLVKEDYEAYLIETAPVHHVEELQDDGESMVLDNDTLEEPVAQATFVEFAGDLVNWRDYLLEGCLVNNYQSRWGDDAKFNAVTKSDAVIYFKDLINSYGKMIIDSNTNNSIKSIVESLRTNLRTRKYFDRDAQQEYTQLTVLLQLPVYFEHRGIKCKALLDMVIVCRDEQGRIMWIQPIDLKTMNGNTFDFISSVRSYRYDIQAAWYTLALSYYYAVGLDGGIIKPFKFIVESSTFQGKPLIFEVTKSLLHIGKSGRQQIIQIPMNEDVMQPLITPIVVGYPILGYEQLLDTYLWHQENGWEAEKEVQVADANENCLLIDWNGLVEREDFFEEVSEQV